MQHVPETLITNNKVSIVLVLSYQIIISINNEYFDEMVDMMEDDCSGGGLMCRCGGILGGMWGGGGRGGRTRAGAHGGAGILGIFV